MEKQSLTDERVYPDKSVIEAALGTAQFNIFLKFIENIEALNLSVEWRYYNDGKAWLGKILTKKKNIAWLSVWNVGFKVTVFFTEKTIEGFKALEITTAKVEKPTGKLLPIITTVKDDAALNDVIKILGYKIQLK
ncbi:MAG: DUF3788 domain-containing protein [Nitrososphaerota archaeon]|jgi:hypothetical protein|nr:DUF3788 domain-containing protein [Nitrososphaerota archaeon]